MYNTPHEAIRFFNSRRSQGPSLTLPSQIRTVNNFFQLLQRAEGRDLRSLDFVLTPKKYLLKTVIMTPVPLTGLQGTGCKPAIELYDRSGLTVPLGNPKWTWESTKKYRPSDVAISINVNKVICGDTLIKVYHVSAQSLGGYAGLIFRLHFHTSFLESNYWDLPLAALDAPGTDLSVLMSPSKILDDQFRIRILTEEVPPDYTDIPSGEISQKKISETPTEPDNENPVEVGLNEEHRTLACSDSMAYDTTIVENLQISSDKISKLNQEPPPLPARHNNINNLQNIPPLPERTRHHTPDIPTDHNTEPNQLQSSPQNQIQTENLQNPTHTETPPQNPTHQNPDQNHQQQESQIHTETNNDTQQYQDPL